MPGLSSIGESSIGSIPTGGFVADINDLSHTHTMDQVSLSLELLLDVNSGQHNHTLEQTTMSQVHNINANELQHNHVLDSLFLLPGIDAIKNPPDQNKVNRATFGLRSTNGRSESPFTLNEKTFEYHGDRWEGEFEIIDLFHDEMPAWKAWLAVLQGQSRSFYLNPPHQSPRGKVAQNASVRSVTRPRELGLKGLGANVTDVFLPGDYIQLDETDQLLMVVDPANTNGSGETTVTVQPKIREAPSVDSTVETQQPQGLFHLDTNRPGWQENPVFNDVSFGFVEVVNTGETLS